MTHFYCAPCDRICAESGTCDVCDEIVRPFEPAEVHLTAGVFQPAFTPALPTYTEGCLFRRQAA